VFVAGLLVVVCSMSACSRGQTVQAHATFSMTQAGELDSSYPKILTVPLADGHLHVTADVVAGAARNDHAPAFRCVVRRLVPGGDGAVSAPLAVRVATSPQFHHTVFTLTSDQLLQAGTYRLWLRGHGGIIWLAVSTQASP
jgi:hypothetical protein